MPIVTWSEEFSVNVKEIDAEHQQMLKLVNNLHAAVEDRIDKNTLQDLLVELVSFTHAHFSAEERLMKEHAYPEFVEHHKEHRILLRHMQDLVAAVSSGKYPTFYSDYDVSSDWALSHIFDHDKNLGAFLNTKGIY